MTSSVMTQQPITVLPVDERVSPDEIVRAEDQAILETISERTTEFCFIMGDMVGKYLREAEAQGFRVRRKIVMNEQGEMQVDNIYVTQQQVCEALGHYARKAGRTMRYYYETARFYPLEAREEYKPFSLDFSFFVVARSFRDRWREVLDWAVDHPQADCDTVRAVFLGKLDWNEAGKPLEGKMSLEQATTMVGALSKLVNAVSGFIKHAPLGEELARRAMRVLGDFRSLLTEIAQELDEKKKQAN